MKDKQHESHEVLTYHIDHKLHPELDHKYDDKHDIEPVHFHEHAILKSVKPSGDEEIMDQTPFEHEEKHLGMDDAHFWATHHEGETSLYDRLKQHYEQS